jgi:hypothetical protein
MSILSVHDIQGISAYGNTIRIPQGHNLETNGQVSVNGTLKIPNWTTSSRPASPSVGMIGLNTEDEVVEVYVGGNSGDNGWIVIGSTASNDWENVITTGLILHLDALNPESYSGTGTTWYDFGPLKYQATMSNLTASNWVTIDGTKAFETNDTNNQGFRISNFAVPGTSRTYELWLKSKSFGIGWQTWFDDSGNERVLFGTSTNTLHIYPDVNLTANLSANVWYHLAYTLSGTSAVGYVNGQQIGTGTYTSGLASGNITLYLLGDSGSEISSGYCPIMRVYNRPLSASEIATNYNAQKARFGL